MLQNAELYIDTLRTKDLETWYQKKYMYYHYNSIRNFVEPMGNDGDYSFRRFVSLDKEGNIIGYFCYEIDRCADVVSGLGMVNYSDEKRLLFGKDLYQLIDDIFCKFGHNKLEWCVIVGNPIEKAYDNAIQKYGGQIIGIHHQKVKCIDGKLYDVKDYELFREDYLPHRPKIFLKNKNN